MRNNSVPCKPGKSRDRRATEEALIAAAALVFSEQGYDNATTRNIAEVANCSEALIQRYFNGKAGLLYAVLGKEEDRSDLAAFLQRPLLDSLKAEAQEFIRFTVNQMTQRSDQMRIVVSRVLLDPAFRVHFNRISIRDELRSGLMTRLARYEEAGQLDPSCDQEAIAEMLMMLIFDLGFLQRELLMTSTKRIEWLTEHIADLFSRAVSIQRGVSASS